MIGVLTIKWSEGRAMPSAGTSGIWHLVVRVSPAISSNGLEMLIWTSPAILGLCLDTPTKIGTSEFNRSTIILVRLFALHFCDCRAWDVCTFSSCTYMSRLREGMLRAVAGSKAPVFLAWQPEVGYEATRNLRKMIVWSCVMSCVMLVVITVIEFCLKECSAYDD